MVEVAARELRNRTRDVLTRVEAGEEVVITVNGRPAALLRPITSGTRWISRRAFLARVAPHQADPALTGELAELAPDTTADLRL